MSAPTSKRPYKTFDLWTKVQKTDSCWLWIANKDRLGYGRVKVNNRKSLAHRVIYEQVKGPIPEGMALDHLCRVPSCVNPDHLEPVTLRENILRGTGTSALNAQKTHCNQGHPFDAGNTYFNSHDGRRTCRICRNARVRKSRNSRAALAATESKET